MARKTKKLFKWLIWLIVLLLIFNFYRLSYNPYGILFWSNIYIAILLIIIQLILFCIKLYKKGSHFKSLFFGSFCLAIIIFTEIISSDYRVLLFPETLVELTKEKWNEDVIYLKNLLVDKHPNVFDLISKKEFEKHFDYLESKLDSWSDDKIKLEMMKIVSKLNDGHTIIPPQPAINFHCLPIVMHKFEDGVYIINASNKYKSLINARVDKIGNFSTDYVFQKLKPYIGIENEGGEWDRFPLYAGLTELIYDLGISDSKKAIRLSVSKDGEKYTEIVESSTFYQWFYFYFAPNRKNNRLPYEHKILNKSYWFNYNESNQELYVNVNDLQDHSKESIKEFSFRLNRFIKSSSIKKTILDLRNNRGGNNFKARHLLKVFRDNSKINKQNAFFTLISRRTFSAAVNLATLLENQTKTIFVGEPTGQGPTQYGDAKEYVLPNSSINIFISSLKWKGSLPLDNRQSIDPDIEVKYFYDDYINNFDPVFKVINDTTIPEKELVKSNGLIDNYIGRYIINNDQIVEISKDSLGYSLAARDYVPGSLRDINTKLYNYKLNQFKTDINGFRLQIKNNIKPQIIFENDTIQLSPIKASFQFPIQKIIAQNYEEGIIELNNNIQKYKDYPLEGYFNRLGYKLLNNKKVDLAIKIFKINTKLYPNSYNTWDSYGEALLDKGLLKEAKQAYSTVLKLNPTNKGAKKMLIKIN